jgi:cation diffusion facilitator CzcD-associated flavoprotein CzcO
MAKEPVDLARKLVAVIGTGPTGVQLITEIAKEVGHLTVFQRTPNYCAPSRNSPVSPETQRRFKANYQDMHKTIRETPGGFVYDYDHRKTLQVPREERLALYEKLWAAGFLQMAG